MKRMSTTFTVHILGSIHSNAKTGEHHHQTPKKEQVLPFLRKHQSGPVNKTILVPTPGKVEVKEQER